MIGQRCKPSSNNQPGYIRIDSLHQGDQDKRKGVYHINAVDGVTQMQVVVTVARITEAFMLVESKNGSVIRKMYGYSHIPQQYAKDFDALNSGPLYRNINFHRPCYFPTTITSKNASKRISTFTRT